MQNLRYYKGLSEEKIFETFLSSLQKSVASWDYFVDWTKVRKQIKKLEVELNILNSLIGSKNIENDFMELCKKYPEVKAALPLLIAVRHKKLVEMPILLDKETLEEMFCNTLFEATNTDYENLLEFFVKSGLKEVFSDKAIKNVVDYVTGIEVGMDTNGRKNRTGTIMESIVEKEIAKVCEKHGYEYLRQVKAKKISEIWKVEVPVDKSERCFDFAIKTSNKVTLLEVNFYGGGGTKLKATAGEYVGLAKMLKDNGIDLIWVTDGAGWITEHIPLSEAFSKNDYIFNLHMIKNGILEEVL